MDKIHNRKPGQKSVGFGCNSKNKFPRPILFFRLFSAFAFSECNVRKIGRKLNFIFKGCSYMSAETESSFRSVQPWMGYDCYLAEFSRMG